MKIKTNGAEFTAFYNDPAFWPEGVWHDDTLIVVDGSDADEYDNLPANAEVLICSGYVIGAKDEDLGSFVGYFKKWRKSRTVRTVSVEVGIADYERFVEMVAAIGGKVIA